jgi:hypothetical protein
LISTEGDAARADRTSSRLVKDFDPGRRTVATNPLVVGATHFELDTHPRYP